MATLIEFLLFIVAGTTAVVNPNVPGAVSVEFRTTRQVWNEQAPAFRGAVDFMAPADSRVVDCAFLPYWEGETRYPCAPYVVRLPAREPVTIAASAEPGAEPVVVVVRVLGYPPAAFLPLVAR